jgi:putative DNA primase/helicase
MIIPKFEDLSKIETFTNHIEELLLSKEVIPHKVILEQLIDQCDNIDFEVLAFPQINDLRNQLKKTLTNSEEEANIQRKLAKLKINPKHYRILTIAEVLKLAEKNDWGLSKNQNYIYLYNGSFWSDLDKETFQKFLGRVASAMGVKWDLSKDYQFREQLFKQFLSEAYLPTPPSQPETVLINLSNGTFEISPKSKILRPFNRADFLTYQLPFQFNPSANAPLFHQYLNKVLPDKERQMVLAEYLGSIFIKNGSKTLKEEKALILYGSGANGKSVFFEIVNALLGPENVSSYSLQSLTNETGYFRAKLANKLVNYASEINGKLETSIFKQLVSGEPVEARLPYGEPFMLKQYAKLIFNCNELPKEVEHTNAYFRRFLIIPFDITIPEEEQDKNLHVKIIESELSGIFNWVLEGLNRILIQKRFSNCEAAKIAIEQYKTESNSIRLFLDDYEYIGHPEGQMVIKQLYQEYKSFCIEDGMPPFKKQNFIRQLKSMGIAIERQAGTGKNIALIKKSYPSYSIN